MTSPVAIVLAAGEGRRMGGPKALLVVDRKPLVLAHVQRLREVGCQQIVVVVREPTLDAVRAILCDQPEALVISAHTTSMAASLSLGLARIPSGSNQAVVVSPVDTLPVRRSTLNTLLQTVMKSGVQVATPCYRTRGGHPVVARQSLLRVFLEGFPGTLRELIQSTAQRCRVEVDDPAVAGDLDTPTDLASLRPGLLPQFTGELT